MNQFDLDTLSVLLASNKYEEICVQFVDELLPISVDVYIYLQNSISIERKKLGLNPDSFSIYMTADSTWGSSADDVSAAHIDGEVLVYFGSDLSSSSSIPVIVVPPQKFYSFDLKYLDVSKDNSKDLSNKFAETLCQATTSILNKLKDSLTKNIAILYDPSYIQFSKILTPLLQKSLGDNYNVSLAKVPAEADLSSWGDATLSSQHTKRFNTSSTCCGSKPEESCCDNNKQTNSDCQPTDCCLSQPTTAPVQSSVDSSEVQIGGLFLPNTVLSAPEEWTAIYLGNKLEQLEKVILRISHSIIFQSNLDLYSENYTLSKVPAPEEYKFEVTKGSSSYELPEELENNSTLYNLQQQILSLRYSNTLRVKKAKIVGIILSSMGIHHQYTQSLIDRIELILKTANKKFYTFVMGRLNEAKLCNFPEIDMYVLIANEDAALVKPKTFPVPVISPFELEIGLGAREWNSYISTNIYELLESDINETIEKIKEADPYYDEDAVKLEEEERLAEVITAASYENILPSNTLADEADEQQFEVNTVKQNKYDDSELSKAIQAMETNSMNQLTVFESAASEYYDTRTFKGLDPHVNPEENTEIQMGLFGIATEYTTISNPSDMTKD